MSILDMVKNDIAATAGKTEPAAGKPAKAKTAFWLNVGVTLAGYNEDGSDLFVSLPLGIPLDDLSPQKVTGNNERWRQLVEAKNSLLKAVQTQAQELKPGERVTISGLTCEVARAGEQVEPNSNGDNPMLKAMFAQLS